MAKTKINQEIEKITEQIIKNYKPEKIILFGSYAWGKPNKSSDVDLFIVKKTEDDPIRRCYEVRKAANSLFPLDVLVFNPKEIKERIKLGDFFLEEVTNRGKIIYEEKKQ